MNKLNYLLLTGIVIGFVGLAGCGDDNAPTVDPVEEATTKISKTWGVDPAAGSVVMYKTEDRTTMYDPFSITISSTGSYTTTSDQVDDVTPWPSSGSWAFTDEAAITSPDQSSFSITRNDGLVIDVNLSDDGQTMELNFDYDKTVHEGSSRTFAVDGSWKFVLNAE